MVQRVAARTAPPAAPAQAPAARKSPAALVNGARTSVAQALASTLGMQGERMSKVDTAWLRMDSPSNLMMIVGVWILRPGIGLPELRERVRERLLPYRRFMQIACEDAAGAQARAMRVGSPHEIEPELGVIAPRVVLREVYLNPAHRLPYPVGRIGSEGLGHADRYRTGNGQCRRTFHQGPAILRKRMAGCFHADLT